jgi:Asp-tRNA(Asn)/Glu-tRNA(Gln) amidotransferase A subunit family amidase
VEVVDAVLDRLDRLDPTLHMFTTVVPDQARQDAKRIEADLSAGREVGPLGGVPTGVKDLIYAKGVRTASGSHAYTDFVPDEDDVVVERIKAGGAVVIGKTQVPEFGYSGTGQTPLGEPTSSSRSGLPPVCGLDRSASVGGTQVLMRGSYATRRTWAHSGSSMKGLRLPCRSKIAALRCRSQSVTGFSSCQDSTICQRSGGISSGSITLG